MKQTSQSTAKRPITLRWQGLLLGSVSLLGSIASAHAEQPGVTTQTQQRTVTVSIPAAPGDSSMGKLNPTGRAISLTVPLKDGGTYLGDVALTILPDDQLQFSAQRILDLLSNILDPQALQALQSSFAGKSTLSPEDFAASGVTFSYNPQTLELNAVIASERRASRSVAVTPLDRARVGTTVKAADASAYLNVRGSLDYIHTGIDDGFQSPNMYLDGAVRLGGVVLESEATWQPDAAGVDFQRLGSRFVYDDQDNLMRWSAGDLQPVARGFQSTPEIAGLSVFRSYSVLQPQQIIRPRGDRSFKLDRPSTVEVQVNGQIVRRLQLNPGNYNLRDFPFTQGANDIRLTVIDDTGRSEILRFNVFLEQSQLAKGLSEFGLYAGVHAPMGLRGPDYSDKPVFSGFYRRGISDFLTLGVNAQADDTVRMGGVEAVLGTSLGTIATNFSLSDMDGFGAGRAIVATFQRQISRRSGQADNLSLFFESRSANFASLGTLLPNNPYSFEVGGGYSHAFTDAIYAGVDVRHSHGRGLQPDVDSVRGTAGWRISPTASLTGDVRYEKDSTGSRVEGLLSLVIRLGRYSSVRSEYDTRDNRARMSYQTMHGQGVGSYNVTADVERGDSGSGLTFNGNYFANRAELGLSHYGYFEGAFGESTSQRTSLRFGSSLTFADGTFSMGRPIYDSFAIVKPYKGLKNTDIVVEPNANGFTANSGILRAGTHPSLSSYADRTVTIDAPNAKAGVDLGQGSFHLFPSYRSGFLLEVGSAYNVTALGRLKDVDGEAVSLVTGVAIELAHPEKEPVAIFTNREGSFGAAGLAPGKWRIEMLDAKKSVFEISIPESADGVVRLGEITPDRGQ